MRYDIVGFGTAAYDTIMEVDLFPASGGKKRILSCEIHGGGLTTTALVAAAQLGASCWYGGPLGDNATANFIREQLHKYGVAVPEAGYYPSEYQPYQGMVFVEKATGERTILWSDADVGLPQWNEEMLQIALSAKVLFADNNFASALLPLYRQVREKGLSIVGDFEDIRSADDKEAFSFVDHPILPARFALEYTSASSPSEAAQILLREPHCKAVVVTDGQNGAWFMESESDSVQHQPAFSVLAVDTTGCGDVFHGAYSAGLAFGWDIAKRVRYASATAALKATRKGGQTGTPTLGEVEKFLHQ